MRELERVKCVLFDQKDGKAVLGIQRFDCIENLPDGNRGIAVELLSAVGIKPLIAALGTKQSY